MKNISAYKSILLSIALLILLNIASTFYFERFDLTQDNRYTLAKSSKNIISDVDNPIVIDVFLDGNFPPEFRRLQNETRQLLEEFAAYNTNIKFEFVNPINEYPNAKKAAEEFYKLGMPPARVSVKENGQSEETVIFPWAIANLGKKSVKIELLKNNTGSTDEERVTNSVQQLEYGFIDAFQKLLYPKSKKIAVMRGNGELSDAYIADFIKTLQQYYFIAPFTLDSVAKNPQKTLQNLQKFDLILEPKPTIPYSEKEKYVLDQYLMNGGKAVWLTENVAIDKDSLLNPSGTAFAIPKNLNLLDYFFSYGIRINPDLVNDLYSAPIILASGNQGNTRFNPYPWFYSPLTSSTSNNPIVSNIEAVKFDFANPIDTLANGVKKTILLSSSPRTKVEGTPRKISLAMVGEKPAIQTYTDGEQALAVLLEGNFSSVYKNRIKPFKIKASKDNSKNTQLLVVSDGDVIKNELQKGRPLPLGFQRYTGKTYGNKTFLLNAINYMLDDRDLLKLRSKEIKIPFLDPQKIKNQRFKWQFITIGLPLAILGICAMLFLWIRTKRYKK
ncbi:gliding motility-associated ABC transporter substrate-binding protein GldG [Zunongwangia sp.]|uniref:gliding motility-associated ABC transporter substrate-binding protein GldG n=1 Tax=Zunongwangia sp. TaxID=1965325 RepID=UPI003AA80F9C